VPLRWQLPRRTFGQNSRFCCLSRVLDHRLSVWRWLCNNLGSEFADIHSIASGSPGGRQLCCNSKPDWGNRDNLLERSWASLSAPFVDYKWPACSCLRCAVSCSLRKMDECYRRSVYFWFEKYNFYSGRACNSVITGHVDGSIHFWSSIDLSHVRSLATTAASCISLVLSDSGGVLFTLGSDGLLSVWAQSENQRETRKPLVISFEKTT